MSKMKRLCALLLLGAMLTATACASADSGETTDTTATADTAETVETTAAETEISDDLPEEDFGGKDFRILTIDKNYGRENFEAEEENGALIHDAVYRRNRAVEERYNVKIKTIISPDVNPTSFVTQTVTSGEDAFDLVSYQMIYAAVNAVSKHFIDINTLDYINPDKPWWNHSCYENLTIGDQTFLMAGPIAYHFITYASCVLMNKNIYQDLHGDPNDMYDKVLSGDFTIDYYTSLITDTWQDVNGDSTMDMNDKYGLSQQSTTWTNAFAYGFGERTVNLNDDGEAEIIMNLDKWSSMVEKVYNLLFESNGTFTNTQYQDHKTVFMSGNALFTSAVLSDTFGKYAEMNEDFAILPYPKWDEAQAEYHSIPDGAAPMEAIPITVADPDFVAIVTEAMASESYKSLLPVVFDTALKVRGARDEKSVEVISLIEQGLVCDFGHVFSNNGSALGFTMGKMMTAKSKNIASYYETNVNSWQAYLDGIMDTFYMG